ncbi:MAG: OPT/YSL family transporter, partial [Thermoanaerobaculia bacterium]|nr:OPT/YSL family transporter [Thermoanaerobaculia bacterium]
MAEQDADGRVVRHGPYPEITWAGILVGYVIGALIAVSIGYLSLKLGFSIEGSELAAILGFGVLRGVMRRHSIIENNINQTLASGVNGASAGMMFSVPAIFILGYTDFSRTLVVLACI